MGPRKWTDSGAAQSLQQPLPPEVVADNLERARLARVPKWSAAPRQGGADPGWPVGAGAVISGRH